MRGILCLLFLWSAMPCMAEPIDLGTGQFTFVDPQGNAERPIRVFFHRPKKFRSNGAVLFVMHGVKRNAETYRDKWIKYSDSKGFLLLVPEFSKKHYSKSRHYNLGFMRTSKGQLRDKAKWSFTAIERIFDHVVTENQLGTKEYSLYGHSAGGQFVHRFVLFMPDARYKLAIAANPGWYTMLDQEVLYPYGLEGVEVDETQIEKCFSRKFVLLLGSADTNQKDKNLRKTPEANAQGPHRFARGKEFIRQSRTLAKEMDVKMKWRMQTVRNVGHSNSKMAPAAAKMVR